MSITDLLARIPFPPRRAAAPADVPVEDTAWMETAWTGYSAPAEFSGAPATTPAAPLPSYVVLALGAAALSALGLVAVLLASSAAPSAEPALAPMVASPVAAEFTTRPAPIVAETTFGADPTPVTADVLARLEQSSNEPLHGELTQLLDAIQAGFGVASADLDPALRSYTVRMASRFEWNPDTFHVAVTAPKADLADARARLLRRVFADAVFSRRLQIQTATGPDALTLVTR